MNIDTSKEHFKTHKHHIIPQYYFKQNNIQVDNSKDNLVNLYYTDHILAHYYLIYCSINEKDVLNNIQAFNILLRKQGHKLSEEELQKFLQSSAELEKKRLLYLKNLSKLRNSGGKYVNKNGISKHIKNSEIDEYLKQGWKLGNPFARPKKNKLKDIVLQMK